jgi:transcription elongation factor GreB
MSDASPHGDEGQDDAPPAPVAGGRNYMTPQGFLRLQAEYRHLLRVERPKVVDVVSWAAGNGDRSENGDYLYGKKRLREIDRRLRYLGKRLETALVVDPAQQTQHQQVFFGATITYANGRGEQKTITIVGEDETDMGNGLVSWVSPIARALHKAYEGDIVELRTPGGRERIEVIAIRYG